MWLFTPHGFVSCVAARHPDGSINPMEIVVRARTERHLQQVLEVYAGLKGHVMHTPDSDYAWRVVMEKSIFVELVTSVADATVYDNFKSQCATIYPDDHDYLYWLGNIWRGGVQIQEKENPGHESVDRLYPEL